MATDNVIKHEINNAIVHIPAYLKVASNSVPANGSITGQQEEIRSPKGRGLPRACDVYCPTKFACDRCWRGKCEWEGMETLCFGCAESGCFTDRVFHGSAYLAALSKQDVSGSELEGFSVKISQNSKSSGYKNDASVIYMTVRKKREEDSNRKAKLRANRYGHVPNIAYSVMSTSTTSTEQPNEVKSQAEVKPQVEAKPQAEVKPQVEVEPQVEAVSSENDSGDCTPSVNLPSETHYSDLPSETHYSDLDLKYVATVPNFDEFTTHESGIEARDEKDSIVVASNISAELSKGAKEANLRFTATPGGLLNHLLRGRPTLGLETNGLNSLTHTTEDFKVYRPGLVSSILRPRLDD